MVDIAVIGSGAASTTALIVVLEKLIAGTPREQTLKIALIEKYNEFGKGIPYGSRSSVNSLTITPVADFISSGKERALFFDWLTAGLDTILADYAQKGGLAAERWIAGNEQLLRNAEWDKVYLPRYIFGNYMQQKFLALVNTAKEKQLAEVSMIGAEATDVDRLGNDTFKVILENNEKGPDSILAKKLLIATGSAPVKTYATRLGDSYNYVNEVYEPSLENNMRALYNKLQSIEDPELRNVLLVGSNASSIELLYLLNNRPEIKSLINKIVAVSIKGTMPHHIAETPLDAYPCPHLDEVKLKGDYDVHNLVVAAKKDIEQSITNGTVIVPYVDRIVGYTIELMQPLGDEARRIFFGTYGMQLTRLIRRSGPAYKGASEALLAEHKLTLLKGAVSDISPAPNGAQLMYTDHESNTNHAYQLPFAMVFNCTGSDDLDNSASPLLYRLVQKKLCAVNLSGKGFVVNEAFEASPNLYINGPLLGGNMNKRIYFWHIENLARLLYLAPFLADCLLD
jgi:uncharacterized NAD(P)/FAD-binding protein YdhS